MFFSRWFQIALALTIGAGASAVIVAAYASDEPPASPPQEPGHGKKPGAHTQGNGHGGFKDPAEWTKRWDAPERSKWQQPARVLELGRVRRGARVADIGAGTGYFTRRIARAVGKEGKAIAVDIERDMLAHIAERAQAEGLSQIETRHVEPGDPGLAPASVDAILCVNTWHHLEDRVAYSRKLAKALVQGGRFVLVDWREGELPHGPPPEEKIPRVTMIEEITAGGFKLVEEIDDLPMQYAIAFEPVR